MDIGSLGYFVAVASEGSFSRAAQRLDMSQPSLSQQIKKLERELGEPLFDRMPRGVVLTGAGQSLLDHARKLLGEIADVKQRVRESSGRVCGELSIGVIPTIAPYLLPELLPAFIRRHPDVNLTVREDLTGRLVAAVEDGSLDIAIMSTATVPPSVHLETIGSEPLLAAVPSKHPLARRKLVSLDELLEQRLLVLHDMHCFSQQVNQLCLIDRSLPSIVLRGEHLATIGKLVDSGLGVSIVPQMMAIHDRSRHRSYLPLTTDASRPITIAMSVLRHRSNAVRTFLHAIQAHLGS